MSYVRSQFRPPESRMKIIFFWDLLSYYSEVYTTILYDVINTQYRSLDSLNIRFIKVARERFGKPNQVCCIE